MTFYIKESDTSPALRYALSPSSITLAGASVVFNMRLKGGATKVSRAAATIITNLPPVVEYTWTALNTDTAGNYEGEFEVTYADGKVETFPNSTYIPIKITGDIA